MRRPTSEFYTLSLHDALPISAHWQPKRSVQKTLEDIYAWIIDNRGSLESIDRKSTRLNSSHRCISYAVFCLKKKTKQTYKKHSSSAVAAEKPMKRECPMTTAR